MRLPVTLLLAGLLIGCDRDEPASAPKTTAPQAAGDPNRVAMNVAASLPAPPIGNTDSALGRPVDPKVKRPTDWVTAACADADGHVWVGTEDGRLAVVDDSTGACTWFNADKSSAYDPATAIAADRAGRVWIGKSRSGVTVFNGTTWHTYGLLDGPLGEHINDIEIEPDTGDVWLATNRGITRYAVATDAWTYFTRGDGLPSDDIVALAFTQGRMIVATSDSGVASAARVDNYAKWSTVRAADVRHLASGPGIASDWCNDVVADAKGNVYVASVAGLSVSRDAGATWTFVRGKDWAEKAEGATHPPTLTDPAADGLLGEDCVTALAIDESGALLVGHARQPVDVIEPQQMSVQRKLGENTRAAFRLAAGSNGRVLTGTFGHGLLDRTERALALSESDASRMPARIDPKIAAAPLPKPASGDPALVRHFRDLADRAAAPSNPGAFLGTDWLTGGDFLGRYGWTCWEQPSYSTSASDFHIDLQAGPHRTGNSGGVYTYHENINSDDSRHLFTLNKARRMQGEWNDGSWQAQNYPYTQEGPDLWVRVQAPEGLHRVSIYVINNDPHGNNAVRDYLIELKQGATLEAADVAPAIARSRARAPGFAEGVYVQFLVGAGDWWIKVGRNGSPCTKISGVFIDSYAADDTRRAQPSGLALRPKWDGVVTTPTSSLEEAVALIRALDGARERNAAIDLPARIAAYRVIAAVSSDEAMKHALRWATPIWTSEDRAAFDTETKRLAEDDARRRSENAN